MLPTNNVYIDLWCLSERLTGLAEVDGSGSARLNERQEKLDMLVALSFMQVILRLRSKSTLAAGGGVMRRTKDETHT